MPISCNIGGVYHKGKPYVNIGGVWHKAKKVYVNIGGVWRQCYSSGIAISQVSGSVEIWKKNDGYELMYQYGANVSANSDGVTIGGSMGMQGFKGYFKLSCHIKVPISISYPNQNLLSVVGDITIDGSVIRPESIIGNINLLSGSTSVSCPRQTLKTASDIYLPDGPYSVNSIFTTGNITQPIDSYEIQIDLISSTFFASDYGGMEMSIPWSVFTWLPTDDKLIYQP